MDRAISKPDFAMISTLRFPLRRLAASPGFTITALLTLALGIGVNTSMFSVLSTLTLRGVPYPEGERIVRVYRTSPQSQAWPHSAANVLDYQAQNQVFENLAATQGINYTFADPGQPASRMRGMAVSANFFAVLGVAPARGRVFTAEEDQPGRDNVGVLNHSTWVNRFGGDPAIVGRDILLNGKAVTVLGVMPAGFEDRQLWGRVEIWRPVAFSPRERDTRFSNYLGIVARLKPGVSLDAAQAAMKVLAAQFAQKYPFMAKEGLRVVPLARTRQGESDRNTTWFVVGLAAFVLLIACANLANLQFARAAGRAREYAIRSALGASRFRLMRDLLAESVLLGLAGGALGLIVAAWSNDLIGRRLIISNVPGVVLPVDFRLIGFALLVSIATGVAFGLLPAWLASRTDVNDALKSGARGSTAGRGQHRLRHALIVTEVALALVLLSGAGFFVRGLQRFGQRELGWQPDGLLTGYVALNLTKYNDDAKRRAFQEALQPRLAALPGVERASIASTLPTWGYGSSSNLVVEGRPPPAPGQAMLASVLNVDSAHFDTLGIRLIEGRNFDASDRPDAPPHVIINETMARTVWPGESPLGKRVGYPGDTPSWREIIGVVKDVSAAANLNVPDTRFVMFRSIAQSPSTYLTLALRTKVPPETLAGEVRRAVAAIDPDQPVHDIATVRHEIGQILSNVRLVGWMLVGFSTLGVALAALGIYGVISGSVVQRTNEIGIRVALGAQLRDILTLVLGQGLRLALLGTALGLAGAFAVARLLRAIMPELRAADAATALGVTALLLSVAAFACWLPARRATKVDPMTALRAE
jgi:putative ABC transport system permease protein